MNLGSLITLGVLVASQCVPPVRDAGTALPDAGPAPTDGGTGFAVIPVNGVYQGYEPSRKSCTKLEKIDGFAPDAPGRFPVMLYTVGTFGIHDSPEALTIVREMAKRGFFAVSVEYVTTDVGLLFSCDSLNNNSRCAYSPALADSALSWACAQPKADCSRGVVTAGMSQGAAMAVLASNYDAGVEASWVMGFGGISAGGNNCPWSLPAERLRIVDGQEQTAAKVQAAAGTTCTPQAQSCLRPNGSGWVLVQHGDVEDGNADHCYYIGPNANGREVGCSNNPPRFDVGWAPPARNSWSLDTNLDWLAGFTH